MKYLSENDEFVSILIVLVQINLNNRTKNSIVEFYDILYQTIKSKNNFNFPNFFEYIYGNYFSKTIL